ncbi:MAG: DNA recombination protein RmuC [Mycoplasma sp.]
MSTFEIIIVVVLILFILLISFLIIKLGNNKNTFTPTPIIPNNQNELNEIHKSLGVLSNTSNNINRIIDNLNKELQKSINQSDAQTKNILEKTSENAATLSKLDRIFHDKQRRGRFGELLLENILETIFEQSQNTTSTPFKFQGKIGTKIADAVIEIGNGLGPVAIDSKFISNVTDWDQRDVTDDEFKKAVKARILETAKYLNEGKESAIISIMFIPSESYYVRICSSQELLDYARKQFVVLSSPTTLFAILDLIRRTTEAYNVKKNIKKFQQHLEELNQHHKTFDERFDKLKDNINKTVDLQGQLQITYDKIQKSVRNLANFEE